MLDFYFNHTISLDDLRKDTGITIYSMDDDNRIFIKTDDEHLGWLWGDEWGNMYHLEGHGCIGPVIEYLTEHYGILWGDGALQDICYLDSNFKLNEADFHILQDYLYLKEMLGYTAEGSDAQEKITKQIDDLQPLYDEVWKRNNLHWPQPINPERLKKCESNTDTDLPF